MQKYKISHDDEDSLTSFLEVRAGTLAFEFGITDHYQPIIVQDVSFKCEGRDKLSFKFNDDFGNKAEGVLTGANGKFQADFEVVGEYRSDFSTYNVRRNYGRYRLQIDHSK
jgi:hypothetical protein